MNRVFLTLLVIAFVLAGFFGASFAGMAMGHGNMAGCPVMGHGIAVCDMNPLEHLNMWQTMFAATLAQSPLLFAIVLLAFLFFASSTWLRALLAESTHTLQLVYVPAVSHDPLRRFTARGLLHPKIF